ncbi:MAG: DUF1631 family protein, partial [Sedimenticola sp.]
QDRSFFSNKGHPARQLLNSLAKAAVGWSEEKSRSEGSLYARIASIVERINNEFIDDIGLFEELNEQFAAFLARENHSADIAEARATQVTQGKERLNSSRERVFQQIRESLLRYPSYPTVVAGMATDAWKDVLLLIALRKGLDSADWKYSVELLDKLLWSVQPKDGREERQELLQAIPDLLKGLRAGLTDLSYDQHKMTRIFKELQSFHLACLKGEGEKGHVSQMEACGMLATSPHAASPEGRENTGASQGVAAEASLQGRNETAVPDDAHLQQAKAIEVGTWLDMTGANGKSFRAKLAWRSDVTGRCLFVNRKGMKVAELQLEGLAMWLKDGRAASIDRQETPLMDRALKAMVDVLNDTESKAR